jgi:hypothetical protein
MSLFWWCKDRRRKRIAGAPITGEWAHDEAVYHQLIPRRDTSPRRLSFKSIRLFLSGSVQCTNIAQNRAVSPAPIPYPTDELTHFIEFSSLG